MVLVSGATGHLGRGICRLLASKGQAVRGLVRATSDPGVLNSLKSIGVELVRADLKAPATLNHTCSGVETVISTATATRSRQDGDSLETVDARGILNLIDAAKESGVSHFILTSVSGNMGRDGDNPLVEAKRGAERHLRDSEMTFTILRPTYFMEVWLSPVVGFHYSTATATVYGGGEGKISWVSRGDVARLAVECVANPAARNAVIELGGPEALSPREVIHIFEETGNRPFEVQYVPEEALRARSEAATDSLQKFFASAMRDYAHGDRIEMDAALKRIPLHLTTVREYAQRVLSA